MKVKCDWLKEKLPLDLRWLLVNYAFFAIEQQNVFCHADNNISRQILVHLVQCVNGYGK